MKKIVTCLFVLISFMSTTYGQSGSVKGTVKDSNGDPLIGATVQVENTTQAVVTDIEGNYILPNVPQGANLVFSYIGMDAETVSVGSRTVIDATLESDISELEEVIVIGYGTTTKRKAVGAVSTLGEDKLENSTFQNVQSALQGQVAGLYVQSTGGGVNDLPTISIRGGGTPLYVIDGIISDETAFSMLDSDDIESLSFLKDASATAVYGSQAGDGIVLVTTKRGKGREAVITYSGSISLGMPTTIADRLSTQEYMNMYNDMSLRESGTLTYTQDQMDLIGESYLYPDNNWYDILFKDFSVSHKHNVSAIGNGENGDYYISVGNYNTNGLLENNLETLNRTNFRSNVSRHFDKINLDLSGGLSASIQDTSEPWYKNYTTALYIANPLVRAYNPDGTLSDNIGNPLLYFNEDAGYNKWSKQNMMANLDLTWRPTFAKGLIFGAKGAYTSYNYMQRKWAVYPEMFSWDDATQTSTSIGSLNSPNMTSNSGYSKNVDFEGRVAYVNTFGKHTIDLLGLYTQRTTFSDFVQVVKNDYYTSALDQISAGPTDATGTGYSAEGANAGVVFRAKYDYDSKYIVEFSGRYDGNDNFAEGQKWGFFPAVSGVWIMSDESFMQGLQDRNIINFMKVRASYGKTGITEGVDRFGYISSYAYTNSYYTTSNGTYVNTFKEGDLVDPDNLSWYTRTSSNIGVDLAFLNSKLEASFDYFFYETTGWLCSPANTYSTTLGTDLPQITSDTNHRRAGYEINLRYKQNVGDWSYSIGANAAYYNQLYTQLDTESLTDLKNPYTRQTQQTDYFTTLLFADGLFQSSDDILTSAQITSATVTQVGEVKYVDANGDGVIDSNDYRRFEESNYPHFTYGIDFSVSYKNLSLSGLIQGTGDYYVWLGSYFSQSTVINTVNSYGLSDRYSSTNTDAKYPFLSSSETYNGNNNSQKSSLYFENAKYVRLKNLQVSYDLKKSILKKIDFIEGMSVTISGTNLLTFSKILDFMDPEQALSDETNYSSSNSIAGDGSPMYKTFSMGVNIKF